MQFLYLLPFVGVVSHAAALPQPAGLSDKYSNGVDITLASLFETRSYQPVLNTREDPVTLVLLERRANSGGNSGGTGTPSPPESTSGKAKNTIGTVFGKDDFNCMKLSSTIDRVRDGVVSLPNDIRRVADMIGGSAGKILLAYFRRALYVNTVLEGWVTDPGENVISIIKSGLGVLEYSKIEPSLRQTAARLTAKIQAGFKAVVKAVSYLLKKIGFTNKNMETVHASFGDIFRSYMMFFEELKPLLMRFSAGKVYHGYLFNICKSLNKFLAEQQQTYDIFAKAIEASPPKY
ncbi:hypothetical protein BASA60_004361 [Batrachochytrium salamandrivorans]|nr:hypothetical protein BASA60_004361 [Batrachochytrium salamandrivorans]KAH9273498.1 hypothetical protein BASA83_004164 [Batrachochytrium salamandrivorans]